MVLPLCVFHFRLFSAGPVNQRTFTLKTDLVSLPTFFYSSKPQLWHLPLWPLLRPPESSHHATGGFLWGLDPPYYPFPDEEEGKLVLRNSDCASHVRGKRVRKGLHVDEKGSSPAVGPNLFC